MMPKARKVTLADGTVCRSVVEAAKLLNSSSERVFRLLRDGLPLTPVKGPPRVEEPPKPKSSKRHAWLGSECQRCAMRAGWVGASQPCRGPAFAVADLPTEAPSVPTVAHGTDIEPGGFRMGRS